MHFGITSFCAVYIFIGASVFFWLESENEHQVIADAQRSLDEAKSEYLQQNPGF